MVGDGFSFRYETRATLGLDLKPQPPIISSTIEGETEEMLANLTIADTTSSTTTTTTSALKKIIRKPMIKRSETSYILSTSPFFEKLFSLLNHRKTHGLF